MPSKTPKQAKFMRAIAHGWTPSRMKSPPSRAVAQEFVEADKKYSGGFAENRYWTGGLAAMNEVNSGIPQTLNFQQGGGARGFADMYRRAREMAEGSQDPDVSPYGTEAGTTQQMLDRMGYSGPMGYLRLTSGLRQAGWTPASGSGDGEDLRNTMWYPPEQTLTGEDAPPPRIIPTDPASYIGVSAEEKEALKESPYRDQLREHKAKIAATLGSARGGHVNYYQEGGVARSGHSEDTAERGANPWDPQDDAAAYRYWETRFHKDPLPPPEVAEEVEEEGGVASWLRSIFAPDPEKAIGSGEARGTIEEQMEGMEQAYGGYVGYQAGGLARAAPGRILPPVGGVPPWIEPVGSGPSFMEEEIPGYQFGGMAARMGPAMRGAGRMRQNYRGVPPQRGGIRGGGRQPRGGGRGFLNRFRQQAQQQPMRLPGGGQPQGGGLAAMMQQAMQQQRGQQGGGMPGGPGAALSQYEEMENRMRGPRGPLAPGGGGGPLQLPIMDRPNPNIGRPGYDPIGDMGPITGPGRRPRKPMPGPGTFPPRQVPPSPPGGYGRPGGVPGTIGGYGGYQGDGGGIPGGPRVPPNMRGYLQKQRMMNRPPSGPVGGGGNRIGMQDQQGAQARALQRGTGRPPMSRRFGRGRAGPTR